jgi:hypothetical protein
MGINMIGTCVRIFGLEVWWNSSSMPVYACIDKAFIIRIQICPLTYTVESLMGQT